MTSSKRLGALALSIVALAFVMMAINSCGGAGGGMPIPNNPDDNGLPAGASWPTIPANSQVQSQYGPATLKGGGIIEQVVFGPKGTDDDPVEIGNNASKTWHREVYAMVPSGWSNTTGEPTGWHVARITDWRTPNGTEYAITYEQSFSTDPLEPAGETDFGWVLTYAKAMANGGCGDLYFEARIAQQDFADVVGAHMPERPAPPANTGGGGGNSEWWGVGISGIGILVGLLGGVDPYSGLIIPACAEQDANPPIVDANFDLRGPLTAKPGDQVTITVTSDCPEGWTVTWTGGSKSGHGNGTVTATMSNSPMTFMGDDDCGNSDDLTITPIQQNMSLNVDLTANPSNGVAPLTSTFTATVTGTGHVTKYDWDFDHSGSYELQTTTNTTQHVFSNVGSYVVTVRVSDDQGLTDTDSVTVTVTQGGGPDNPFQGVNFFEIRPNNAPAATLDATMGEVTVFNAVAGNASGGLVDLPSGTTYDWSLVGNSNHPALDKNGNPELHAVAGKDCVVYSTLAEDGVLKVTATNGSGYLEDTMNVTVNRTTSALFNLMPWKWCYDQVTDTLHYYK